MKTKIDFLRILRIGFLAFCVDVVAAPSLVHAQGEIGLSGLKLGMTIDQAFSSLAARGIHPVKRPITGARFKGERLEFYLSDSTIAEPVLVQLAFTESDAMKLYGINFEASEKSGLQYFFSWLEKVYTGREFVEVKPDSRININHCVSSRLQVTLYLNSDGTSRLRYEGGPADVPRCVTGPYLGEKASVVYSVAPIPAAPAAPATIAPTPKPPPGRTSTYTKPAYTYFKGDSAKVSYEFCMSCLATYTALSSASPKDAAIRKEFIRFLMADGRDLGKGDEQILSEFESFAAPFIKKQLSTKNSLGAWIALCAQSLGIRLISENDIDTISRINKLPENRP